MTAETSTGLFVTPGSGPTVARASKLRTGLSSLSPLEYQAHGDPGVELRTVLGNEAAPSCIGHLVELGDCFTYAAFPRFEEGTEDVRDAWAATAVTLDLRFDDGSRLSQAGLTDQHGVDLTPEAQYLSRTLYADQWNLKTVDLERFTGRRVTAVEVVTGLPESDRGRAVTGGLIRGYLDEITIRPRAARPTEPIGWVRTTRGTHSSGDFSRGNNAPIVGIPHGFVFGIPSTDAGNARWPYSWHQHNRDDNRPSIEAFSTSHIPSPWIGDRNVFQIMPSADVAGSADRAERALGFDHSDESDGPHLYRLVLDGGMTVEMTAGARSLLLRFSFPGDAGSIIFDQIDNAGRLFLPSGDGAVTGWVDGVGSIPRMYVYATVDRPIAAASMEGHPERPDVLGRIELELDESRQAILRLGTSFLSVDQAKHNLESDAPEATSFDDVVAATRLLWAEKLGCVEVDAGATADQLTTLYSNLYRLFLYPNDAAEEIPGSGQHYASPFSPATGEHTDVATGSAVVAGPLTVNNGFWDTYRTCWPALTLIDPERAGVLIDGLVQHYRDGGWTSRWTAPGPVDVMTGTTTDTVFADAMIKSVPGFNQLDAWDSALKNATVPSPDLRVGRKGMSTSVFRGYVDIETPEGMSWTLDAAINDYGLMVMARCLLESLPDEHPRKGELAASERYFAGRAARYALVFDERVGFFQGRTPDGGWRLDASEYDPRTWGHDYTETNGWGTAFTVPHDGEGLASLHGGRQGLEDKLDAFFAEPETGLDEFHGSYGFRIHEMVEARDVRMGMLGLSNQPAHHIPYMYLFTGAHHKTQAIVRDSLSRLFVGSEIGQGYPGDEDNGEMSTWHTFSSLGFYPLTVASGHYALTSPLYRRASLRLATGAVITVEAPSNSPENVYIQSLTVNGKPWNEVTIAHDVLAAGAHLVFDLGPVPSRWAEGSVPPSLTAAGEHPSPCLDATDPEESASRAGGSSPGAERVFDDSSATESLDMIPGDWVSWEFATPVAVELYTVTLSAPTDGLFSGGWTLEGSVDGQKWEVLDECREEAFRWSTQTRPFLIDRPRAVHRYRLTASTGIRLDQLELMEPGHRSREDGTP